ncbi:MAG TPA: hypothetical protein VNE00_30090 [Paraburkholderia sp.]|jgi:uncharacterized membrane protein|nr:hypothetical protein [Paraburkholderia sp.]
MRLVIRGNARALSSLALSPALHASLRLLIGAALLGSTLSLLALPSAACAEEPAASLSSDAGSVALAGLAPAAAASPDTAVAGDADVDASATIDVPATGGPAQLLNTPADVVSMNGNPLDDHVLAQQRGGATGLTMIAATPRSMGGNAVTLWDEIAPPAPLPIPVDAARTAQGNAASYLRK